MCDQHYPQSKKNAWIINATIWITVSVLEQKEAKISSGLTIYVCLQYFTVSVIIFPVGSLSITHRRKRQLGARIKIVEDVSASLSASASSPLIGGLIDSRLKVISVLHG